MILLLGLPGSVHGTESSVLGILKIYIDLIDKFTRVAYF
jgi:hypothetical protein